MVPYLLLRVILDAHRRYVCCCLFYISIARYFSVHCLDRPSTLQSCCDAVQLQVMVTTAAQQSRLLQLMAGDDDDGDEEEEKTESKKLD